MLHSYRPFQYPCSFYSKYSIYYKNSIYCIFAIDNKKPEGGMVPYPSGIDLITSPNQFYYNGKVTKHPCQPGL